MSNKIRFDDLYLEPADEINLILTSLKMDSI